MAVSPQHLTEINGVRIQFRVGGSGEPLLLLHGWGSSSLGFMSVRNRLEESFRVVAPDLPGFGFSEQPPVAWGAADYANTIAGLLVATGLGQVHVVGHSFGGLVGTALATSKPELVRSLTLVASPVVRLPRQGGVKARSVAYKGVKTVARLLPPLRDRISEWGVQKFGSTDFRTAGPMRPTLVKVLSEDWRSALPSVRVPTLLVYGEKDEDVPLSVAHAALQELPDGAELVVMQGAGHFPFLDDGERFVETLTGFLTPAGAVADV